MRGKVIEGLHNGSIFEVAVAYYQLDVPKASKGEGSTHFSTAGTHISTSSSHTRSGIRTFTRTTRHCQLRSALGLTCAPPVRLWYYLETHFRLRERLCVIFNSSAFASLVYMHVHFRTAEWISTAKHEKLEACLVRRTNCIICPVRDLLYVSDPFFFSIRSTLAANFGHSFLQFNDISYNSECHGALHLLAVFDTRHAQ